MGAVHAGPIFRALPVSLRAELLDSCDAGMRVCSRCLRMNRAQLQDPVLQQACLQSSVRYQDLGLPQELTVWVDPGEVSCRSDYQQREPQFSTDDMSSALPHVGTGCHSV